MQSGRHYCEPCSTEIREVMRLLSVGRRRNDVTVN